MGISYEIKGDLVVLRVDGGYGPTEFMDTWDAAMEDPAWPATPLFCVDIRNTGLVIQRSTTTLRARTDRFIERAHEVGGRAAVVVGSLAQFGLMRMASAWCDLKGIEAGVFRSEEEALEWLERRAANDAAIAG